MVLSELEINLSSNKETMLVGEEIVYTFSIFNPNTLANTGPINFYFDLSPYFSKTSTTFNGIEISENEIPLIGPSETAEVKVFAHAVQITDNEVYNALAKFIYFDGQVISMVEDPLGVIINEEVIPLLTLDTSASVNQAALGDVYKYTIIAKNEGNINLLNVVINDPLTSSIKFIDESVKINGISHPNFNILSGFSIGSLEVGMKKEVTFDVEVISVEEENVVNTSEGSFSYSIKGSSKVMNGNTISNEESVELIDVNIKIYKNVSTEKNPLILGDTAQYMIIIKNDGKISLTNIIFKDILPKAIKLKEDFITINFPDKTVKTINHPKLESGILIGSLESREQFAITYEVKVQSGTCSGKIIDETFADYDYKYDDGRTGQGESEHVVTTLNVGIKNFSQMSISKCCKIPVGKPDAEEINDIDVSGKVLNSYTLKTIEAMSNENNILSGHKLIVNAKMCVVIEYTSAHMNQQINSFKCLFPISSFIILPEDYIDGTEVKVDVKIENISADLISSREVCTHIVYVFIATIFN